MRRCCLSIGFVLTAILMVGTVSYAQGEYTADALTQQLGSAADDAAVGAICRDFMENASDIVVVRTAQSDWKAVDEDAALSYARDMANQNPDSAKWQYLYGRLVKADTDKILIGRKVIQLDPKWPYGYRLVLATYLSSLFKGNADEAEQSKLEEMLPEDSGKFAELAKLDPKEGYPYEFLAAYQIHTKDYQGALATYDKAKELGNRWPSPLDYINVRILMGQYDQALQDMNAEADRWIADGNLSEADKDNFINYYYVSGLYAAKAFDEVVRFKQSKEGWETDPSALYDIGCAYARSGDVEKSFEFLGRALDNGWERVGNISNDDDLKELHNDARWTSIIDRAKANWDKGRPKRKAEALASKVDEAAPSWSLEDVNGNQVSLADLKGNVLILDFWATWCGPCRMTMPVINDFVKSNDNDAIKVYSINVWEQGKSKPADFMKANDYRMTLLYGNNDLAKAYGVNAIPFMCVIDKDGHIRYKETGYSEGLSEKLKWWTQDLL